MSNNFSQLRYILYFQSVTTTGGTQKKFAPKMTKKKTVKELHEDFKVLEDKVGKLERFKEVFDKLSMVDIGELEKKVKIIDDATSDPKIQHLEKKVNENFVSLKKLLSKKEENKENKFPCKKMQFNIYR